MTMILHYHDDFCPGNRYSSGMIMHNSTLTPVSEPTTEPMKAAQSAALQSCQVSHIFPLREALAVRWYSMKKMLLVLATLTAAVPDGWAQHVPPARIQLDLELVDGSRIMAAPGEENPDLTLHIRFGPASIPLAACEKIEVEDEGRRIVVQWADGDRLTGRPKRESMAVCSLLGRHDVLYSTLRRATIKVLPATRPLVPEEVRVSGSYGHARKGVRGNHQVAYAHDGDPSTTWSSGDWKGWMEFDLGESTSLASIRAVLQFDPPGSADHKIYISDQPIGTDRAHARLLKKFSGHRNDGDVLEAVCPPGASARFVQIHCTASRSWFNIRELEVYPREADGIE